MLAGFLLIQVLGGLTDFPHFAGPQIGFAGCLLQWMEIAGGNTSGWNMQPIASAQCHQGRFAPREFWGKMLICKSAFIFANLRSHGISQLSSCCPWAAAVRQNLKPIPGSLALNPALLEKMLKLKDPLKLTASSLFFAKGACSPPMPTPGYPHPLCMQQGNRVLAPAVQALRFGVMVEEASRHEESGNRLQKSKAL